MPDVTVLMAVHNGEAFLRAAIDSVLAQTYQDFELLIVDDGSTDRSAAICAGYADRRLRVVTLPENRGLSAALNAGLSHTRTPLVARLDADDEALPHRLERQRAFMLSRADVALAGSQAVAMTPDGRETGTVRRSLTPAGISWTSVFDNPFIHPTVMFRTAVVRDALGGYRQEYDPFSQDYDLWCRVMERHAVANLPDRLIRHRVHGSSIMGQLDAPTRATYSARFADIVRTLVMRQARLVCGDAVREQDADLIPGFILGLAQNRIDAFLAMFERLLARFRTGRDGSDTPDFARTLARQFDALTIRVTPPSRAAAARILAHALRRHPEVARRLPWGRALTTLLLGSRGRAQVGQWWRQTAASLRRSTPR